MKRGKKGDKIVQKVGGKEGWEKKQGGRTKRKKYKKKRERKTGGKKGK